VESRRGDLEIDDESMSGVGWSGRVGLVSENVGPSFATDATFEWNGTGDWCTDGGPLCVSIPGKGVGWSGRVGLVSENVGPSFATDATFEWKGTGDWCTDGGPPFVSIPGKSLIGSSP